jgi:amino-acid N-acetyltransferase
LRAGEIPVLVPFTLDSFCGTVCIDTNYVIAGLARGMVETAQLSPKFTAFFEQSFGRILDVDAFYPHLDASLD